MKSYKRKVSKKIWIKFKYYKINVNKRILRLNNFEFSYVRKKRTEAEMLDAADPAKLGTRRGSFRKN